MYLGSSAKRYDPQDWRDVIGRVCIVMFVTSSLKLSIHFCDRATFGTKRTLHIVTQIRLEVSQSSPVYLSSLGAQAFRNSYKQREPTGLRQHPCSIPCSVVIH